MQPEALPAIIGVVAMFATFIAGMIGVQIWLQLPPRSPDTRRRG